MKKQYEEDDDYDYSDEWREREQDDRELLESSRELDEC